LKTVSDVHDARLSRIIVEVAKGAVEDWGRIGSGRDNRVNSHLAPANSSHFFDRGDMKAQVESACISEQQVGAQDHVEGVVPEREVGSSAGR
jgi:hypothetical protein